MATNHKAAGKSKKTKADSIKTSAKHAAPHKGSSKGKEPVKAPVKTKDSKVGAKSKAPEKIDKKAKTGKMETAKHLIDAVKGTAAKAPTAKKERKSRHCTEDGCQLPVMSDHYCRMHYIKNWTTIITGRRAQARANLNKYIESISEKYPEEYMEKIRDDFGSEGAFHQRLRDLGFREEFEATGGGDNPFQMDNFDEFVHGLKFEE
jgi:hypothetical protein